MQITHLIAGKPIQNHFLKMQQLKQKRNVVTVDWVYESFWLWKAAPETDFLLTDFTKATSHFKKLNFI